MPQEIKEKPVIASRISIQRFSAQILGGFSEQIAHLHHFSCGWVSLTKREMARSTWRCMKKKPNKLMMTRQWVACCDKCHEKMVKVVFLMSYSKSVQRWAKLFFISFYINEYSLIFATRTAKQKVSKNKTNFSKLASTIKWIYFCIFCHICFCCFNTSVFCNFCCVLHNMRYIFCFLFLYKPSMYTLSMFYQRKRKFWQTHTLCY